MTNVENQISKQAWTRVYTLIRKDQIDSRLCDRIVRATEVWDQVAHVRHIVFNQVESQWNLARGQL